MREYEFTLLFRADLDEEARNQLIERIERWMPTGEGDEEEPRERIVEQWGERKLAYPIDEQERGYYLYQEVWMDPAGLPELERNLRFETQVLRHLIVRKEE